VRTGTLPQVEQSCFSVARCCSLFERLETDDVSQCNLMSHAIQLFVLVSWQTDDSRSEADHQEIPMPNVISATVRQDDAKRSEWLRSQSLQ
jgi:hypothetical protein